MFIEKDGLTIRRARSYDAAILGKWWRDGQVMAHAGFPLGLDISDEEIKESLERDDNNSARLIIEISGTPVGEMSYRKTDENTAQIGIKICEQNLQGKGHGLRFLKMLINELFTKLSFDRIILDTNLNNIRAQKTYENLGFRKVAVNYDSWKDQLGQIQSSVDYELLKVDYIKQ
ncbi:MAG: GNAT family N-acetyltransferase [Defluviitaleaceae bacterium]|nr:GNAT family N-acetyltransferase [Defluviitaleaceae bacterium]